MQPKKGMKAINAAYKATTGMAAAMTVMKNIKALKAKKAKAPFEALLAPLIELRRVREYLAAVQTAQDLTDFDEGVDEDELMAEAKGYFEFQL